MAVRQRAAALPTLMRALRKEAPPRHHTVLPSLRRAFSLYDQINIIDNVPEDQLRFQGGWERDPKNLKEDLQNFLSSKEFDDTGFKVNGVKYEGSILCVGNLLMSWTPKKFSDITAESLTIFKTMRPIPEILIIGCGRYIQPVNPELRSFIRSIGMKLEVVDSRNAASTYNILNEEGRIIAAALIPHGATS